MTKKKIAKAGDPTKAPAKKRNAKGSKKTLSVYERIYNVQRDLKTVLKSTEHAHSKYMYATERDFIAEVKPLIARERLLVLADTLTHTAVPNTEGQNQHTVAVKFTIVNVDDATQTVPETFYGVGDDKKGSVVGLPIAYTMALKYFLAKTFIAETGTDAEAQDEADSKKRGKGAEETPEQATETIKRMLAGSRNIDGMRDYLTNRLPKITKLNAAQKADIKKAAEARIAELEAGEQGQDPKAQGKLIS